MNEIKNRRTMSFVYAEKSSFTFENSVIRTLNIYGDTKIELFGAVKSHWSPVTRRAVRTYGMSKIAIPDPRVCVAYAGNNLLYASQLFAWMKANSPFEVEDAIQKAYELHLEADSADDIEFIICDSESDSEGRITCIKNRKMFRDQTHAWMGSFDTFREMQRLRLQAIDDAEDRLQGGNAPSISTLSLFMDALYSAVDDSVGGFVINAALRGGEFHYNDYLATQIFKTKVVKPGESIPLCDTKENGGYTVEAFELDSCPCLLFPQTNKALIYSNKHRYQDEAPLSPELECFYLPMLFDPDTNTCLEI